MRSADGAGRGPIDLERLEALADAPEFLERARREFPAFAAAAMQSCDRRRFMQIAAASMALAGLTGCGPDVKRSLRRAYAQQPPGMIAGRPRHYATATAALGDAVGVVVKHSMGRPLKVEGNPRHPASLGATDAIGQATLLGLYDPFRAQTVMHAGQTVSWQQLATAMLDRRRRLQESHGAGLALLTGTVTSPTLVAQIAKLRQEFPALRWHQWEPINRDHVWAGAELAFGRPLEVLPDFREMDVIVAVDSDFLESAPGHLRFAREFAARRRAADVKQHMSRLYALESTPTLAGAKADHRLRMQPDEIETALRHLAARLGVGPSDWAAADGQYTEALDAIARDLQGARGRAIVHVGRAQSPIVHAIAHAISASLDTLGHTINVIDPVAAEPGARTQSLTELTEAAGRGEIDTLLVLDAGNPVYSAPADLGFERALGRVPFTLYLGEYFDETAAVAQWFAAKAHEYEAWSDVRAYDGTVTIQQPLIQFDAERRSAHEILSLLSGDTTPDGQTLIREQWMAQARERGVTDFEAFWTASLRDGLVPDTAAAPVNVQLRPDWSQAADANARTVDAAPGGHAQGLTLLFRPDNFLWDGRFADNGWLQELGRPFTRMTWDNAALIGPATAVKLGLETGDIIELAQGSVHVRAPVWVLPGQADDCITLPLGYGRRRSGPVGIGVGFDAYPLRTRGALWHAPGAALRKIGSGYGFAAIQHESRIHDRDTAHIGTLAEFLANPEFLRKPPPEQSLYPSHEYPQIAWAMAINLNSCIGCQACVAACQAENNSPVVGKREVKQGREMHWLRVDRYYTGPIEDPGVVFQPVPCMHCENAPCEVVCPVRATVHDAQGLNVMVYNRCVGTRFCSNNCPYKVRRFNFFNYTSDDPRPSESWNPEVTVRARGVMEKCTYCLQRTRIAMIEAARENRPLLDGEVKTACQQVCPTEAIVFGNKNDPDSAVARRKASPLDYAMLVELNTRPRTSYEALIRNPNPDLRNV
jgi:MoCo/4Fe-4S cofactor protein with predicted Tat translocation signal